MTDTNLILLDYEQEFLSRILDHCVDNLQVKSNKGQIEKMRLNISNAFKENLSIFREGVKREERIRSEFKKNKNDYFLTLKGEATVEQSKNTITQLLSTGIKQKYKTHKNKTELTDAENIDLANKSRIFEPKQVTIIPAKDKNKTLIKFTIPPNPLNIDNNTKIYASEAIFQGAAQLGKKLGLGVNRAIPTCAKDAVNLINKLSYSIRTQDKLKTRLGLHQNRYFLKLKYNEKWTDISEIDAFYKKYKEDIISIQSTPYIPYSKKQ